MQQVLFVITVIIVEELQWIYHSAELTQLMSYWQSLQFFKKIPTAGPPTNALRVRTADSLERRLRRAQRVALFASLLQDGCASL